jgi:hypothetical protein
MGLFLSNPRVLKTLRYTGAYLLLIACAGFGVIIIEWTRSNIYAILTLLNANPDLIYLAYTWGTYVLYLPYILLITILEPYVNTAAKNGRVLLATRNMLLIEGSIGLLTFLLTQLFAALHVPMGI